MSICAFCTRAGDASPGAPSASRLFRYAAKRYAHAGCLVKNRSLATARVLVHREDLAAFEAALKEPTPASAPPPRRVA